MRIPAIIYDLDGTMANIDHRRHLVMGEKNHWDEFFLRMTLDTVNGWCKELYKKMTGMHGGFFGGYHALIVTGRPDNYREQTRRWLNENEILDQGLYMRKAGDYRDDAIVKKEIYETQIKDKYEVLFVVDDRKKVVDAWRSLGLVCLQCAPGEY